MPEQFRGLDIDRLTKEAEQGHGCALRDAMANLGFEDRFKVLKKIEGNNSDHRLHEQVLDLKASSSTDHYKTRDNATYLTLKVDDMGFLGLDTALYTDTLTPKTVTQSDICTDLKRPNSK